MLRKAENRREWRKLVVNLQWCPNGQRDYGIGEGDVKMCGRANILRLNLYIRFLIVTALSSA